MAHEAKIHLEHTEDRDILKLQGNDIDIVALFLKMQVLQPKFHFVLKAAIDAYGDEELVNIILKEFAAGKIVGINKTTPIKEKK